MRRIKYNSQERLEALKKEKRAEENALQRLKEKMTNALKNGEYENFVDLLFKHFSAVDHGHKRPLGPILY